MKQVMTRSNGLGACILVKSEHDILQFQPLIEYQTEYFGISRCASKVYQACRA